MSDIALPGSIEPAARKGPDLGGVINPLTAILFGGVLAATVLFVAYGICTDIGDSGTKVTSYAPFLLLFAALLIALGFEFVNGFHDTANAVATVIYTRSFPANFAVVWSGVFNLAGVLASSGAVAFGIISLLLAYKLSLDRATKFIPTWVKVAVAIALGLGTMVGWKRIVVTVGEKIGKTHLTYAQGACAEITAAATIAAADMYGLPVSTTHVLSSGVAGTMAANGSGLQLSTVRNIALAWVMTLPAAMVISGTLYWVFSRLF